MTEVRTATFNPPLMDGEREIKTVHMRRPLVDDQLEAESHGGGQSNIEIRVFSRLTGLSIACIKNMDMFEYEVLQNLYKGFSRRRVVTYENGSSGSAALPDGAKATSGE